jgi:cytochrome c peroxidase
MRRIFQLFSLVLVSLVLFACSTNPDPKPNSTATPAPTLRPDLLAVFPNSSGRAQTVSSTGGIDQTNPYFQSLSINGRSCFTCHQASDGLTITPEGIQKRFDVSTGEDPIFRLVDGATSPLADVSSLEARRTAYSMLLSKGLMRVGLPIPDNAEFTLEAVDDPYRFATSKELSLFRRPLPTTNLRFLSTLLWDGRETFNDQTMHDNLAHQSNSATTGHAQSSRDLTDQEREDIVELELQLHTTQIFDNKAGNLDDGGAYGGLEALVNQEFYLGINDSLGLNPKGLDFGPNAMTRYKSWDGVASGGMAAARAAVARGEEFFNTKAITVTGVAGLNDLLGQPSIQGTCTICYDSPNVGNHSLSAPLNIGLTDASQRTPDMPLYTLRNIRTGETIQTTDPGRALVTGKWVDIGKFKGPILRDLASRAPYFHNGSAATLEDAVKFYNTSFSIGFTEQEISDLVAFLKTL